MPANLYLAFKELGRVNQLSLFIMLIEFSEIAHNNDVKLLL